MSAWKQVGENLVRHVGGTYYLRAKVAGKVKRISLQTTDLRIAKLKRDDQLNALRGASVESDATTSSIRTLGDAIGALEVQIIQPHLKPSTKLDYQKKIAFLRKTLPLQTHGRQWSKAQADGWWKAITKKYGYHRPNGSLRLARIMVKNLIEAGVRTTDPLKDIKPLRVRAKHRVLPSHDEMKAIIANVAEQQKRVSPESGNYIAFLAYSGCRHGEARHVAWEDVGKEWVTITGGETGTKNHESRQVPISEPLRAVLDRMRKEDSSGPLFNIGTPRFALMNACERLKLPHMRIHDLRHWFASWCIENGIEIPTIARWVGHKDGGALLMKTYGHLRDQHSLDQAKKLK